MPKLNQILALEKGAKSRAESDLTQAYHALQRTPQLSGIARSYQPIDDNGERLPAESVRVQVRASDALEIVRQALTRLFDLTLTKDVANREAVASIVVDGETLVEDVPVTTLLFLEKQLVHLNTFLSKLPTLDPADTWDYDPNTDSQMTSEVQTTRTKKVPRNHVKSPATDKHPAQVEMYYEDVVVGYWTTRKFSGALPRARVTQLKARVTTLAEAVKVAREQANSIEVYDQKMGKLLFDYLLTD